MASHYYDPQRGIIWPDGKLVFLKKFVTRVKFGNPEGRLHQNAAK